MRFDTPNHLVRGLSLGTVTAREELNRLCRPSLARVAEKLARRSNGGAAPERMIDEAILPWIEMFLQTRNPAEIARFPGDEFGWKAFVAYVVVSVCRLVLLEPADAISRTSKHKDRLQKIAAEIVRSDEQAGHASAAYPSGVLPYATRSFCKPKLDVPGDLIDIVWREGVLWVLVADAMGKSWLAYVLIQGVKHLWRACLDRSGSVPSHVLCLLHAQLGRCLPDGLFAEASLATCSPAGEVVTTAAGGTRILVRRSPERALEFKELSGPLLGVEYPDAVKGDQTTWLLPCGGELLLATDGFYELVAAIPLSKLFSYSAQMTNSCEMYDSVLSILNELLQNTEAHDDITFVTIRKN